MIDKYRQAFQEEARELLAKLESALLDLERTPGDSETVGQAFRALHTIKGSGAMFGFDEIAAFAHDIETAFAQVCSGELAVTGGLIDLTLAAGDQIGAMLDEAAGGGAADQGRTAGIVAEMRRLTSSAETQPGIPPTSPAVPETSSTAAVRDWRIAFRPGQGIFLNGTDPLLLLRELREMGNLRVEADTSDIPPLGELDPDRCYVGWNMALSTAAPREAIRDVFIFVEDNCELLIEPVLDQAAEP